MNFCGSANHLGGFVILKQQKDAVNVIWGGGGKGEGKVVSQNFFGDCQFFEVLATSNKMVKDFFVFHILTHL